jgi:hypothetical protein
MTEPLDQEAAKLDETWARAAAATLRHEPNPFVEAVRELLAEKNAQQSGAGSEPEAIAGE